MDEYPFCRVRNQINELFLQVGMVDMCLAYACMEKSFNSESWFVILREVEEGDGGVKFIF